MPPRLRVGVDENGLGPRLGPLVVTAVAARVDGPPAARLDPVPAPASLRDRLGDSKALVSHGDVALGEAWARAVARRAGRDAADPAALLGALSAEPNGSLRAQCPAPAEAQCWSAAGEAFAASAAEVDRAAADLDALARSGMDVAGAKIAIVCARRLNDAAARGVTRFDADLHAMETLLLGFRAEAGADIRAVCGKVGGYVRYPPAFGPLAGWLHGPLAEDAERSAYRIAGLGEVAFVRDADERDVLVGLASLVGKWARELLMGRIVRFYRAARQGLPDASGYHDPVTARFVVESASVRRRRRVPDACFERGRAQRGRR